jgi:hypothetical protein
MKNLIFVCFSVLALISCKEEAKKTPDTKAPQFVLLAQADCQ